MGCGAHWNVPKPDRVADEIDVREFKDGDKMLIMMEENHDLIKKIYKKFDSTGNNTMSSAELRVFVMMIVPKHSKETAGEHHAKIDRCIDRAFQECKQKRKEERDLLGVYEFSMWLQTALVARFISLDPKDGRRISKKRFEGFLRSLAGKSQGKEFSFQELQSALKYIDENADIDISLSRFVHICLHLMREHMSGQFHKGNSNAARLKRKQSPRNAKIVPKKKEEFNGSWMAHLVGFEVSHRKWAAARERVSEERKWYKEKKKRKLMKLEEGK
mmetsp:Transcript_10180/g.20213  ORF Transcript_10180/g.20213 Transcript_10180/m.20213 type:complete len:273 (-) Transcript_10180:336-1154(-)